MRQRFYNDFELKKATALLATDPYLARIKMEDYLSRYPKDKAAILHYVNALLTVKEYDEAEKILNNFNISTNRTQNNRVKISIIKEHLLFVKVKLFLHQGKYREVIDLISENDNKLFNTNYNQILYYCKARYDLVESKSTDNYIYKQLYNYDEKRFIENLNNHISGFGESDNICKTVFIEDFPALDIVEEIKHYIPSDKSIYRGLLTDSYVFKYDNCGKDSNRFTDYFRVITLHESNKFIAMYPVLGIEKQEYTDLNYLNKNKSVKRLSQIEKFNKKYNI